MTSAVVAPAVPASVTSAPVKPVTASLNDDREVIGEPFVGSAWPAAWLIVTVGAVVSKVTVLSVLVEAVLALPAASGAAPAAIVAMTVPRWSYR